MFRQYYNLPRMVHLLCLGAFINRAGTFIVPFLTTYMTNHLHAATGYATATMGLYGLGSLLGSIIGGQLADRLGRKTVMVFALLSGTVMLLVLSTISVVSLFMGAVLVFAMLGETYRPAAQAMIADITTPEQRTHAFSLLYVAINLGFAIGPALGGSIAVYSFTWLFYGDALTCAAFAVMIVIGIRETLPGRSKTLNPNKNNVLARSTSAISHEPQESTVQAADTGQAGERETPADDEPAQVSFSTALAHMLRDTTFLALCFGGFAMGLLYMQAMSTFPLYLQSLGMDVQVYGFIISFNGAMIVLLQLPLTHWMQGRDRGRLLVLAALLTATGFAFKASAYSEPTFIVTVIIWTFGEMMHFPLLAPIVTELAPANMRARYMGVFGMTFSGANMIGAPIGGLVLEYYGGTALWLGGASLGLIAAVLYNSVGRRIAQPPAQSAENPD